MSNLFSSSAFSPSGTECNVDLFVSGSLEVIRWSVCLSSGGRTLLICESFVGPTFPRAFFLKAVVS